MTKAQSRPAPPRLPRRSRPTMPAKRNAILVLAASLAILLATGGAARADSAIWIGGDATPNIWSDPLNWNPNTTFPNGASDVATFDNTATSFTPTISGTDPTPTITVGSITFSSTATQAFTITVDGSGGTTASLTIDTAAGVANSSAFTQQFLVNGNGTNTIGGNTATVTFSNGATAGTNTLYTLTNGGAVYFTGASNGTTTSSFLNNGGTFDISQATAGSTVTVGSIGDAAATPGSYYLGGNTLATNVPAAASATINGVIQDGGLGGGTGGSLVVNGPGVLSLVGTNTYTGNTTLNSGSLYLDNIATPGAANTNAIGTTGTLIITSGGNPTLGTHVEPTDGGGNVLSSGIILSNNVSILGNFSVATNVDTGNAGNQNFTFGGTVILNDQTNTITGVTAEGQVHFSGQIVSSLATPGGPGGITLADATGVYTAFIYDGPVANSYTGLTTVDSNAFLVLAQQNVVNGAVVGDILVNPGGTAELLGTSNQIATTSSVTVNSTGINLGGTQFQGFELRGGAQTINGLSGNGTVGLGSADDPVTGLPTPGVLTVNSGNFTGNIVDGSFVVANAAGTAAVGGDLVKIGAGTLNLSGTNTYSGTTTVSAGIFQAGSSTGFSPNSAFTVTPTGATPAVLDVNGFNPTVGSLAGSGTVTNSSTTPGFLLTGFDGTNTSFTGALQDGAGPLGLVKTGVGVFTVSNSTYSGSTTIFQGTLQAATTTAFSPNSAYTVSAPGVLDLNGFSNSIGSLAGNGTVTNLGAAPVTLTTGLDNTNSEFFGTIQDGNSTTALVKTGTGAMTLSSPNTFSGGTILQSGTLIINSILALGSGNVTVNGGALQGGNGPTDIEVGGNYRQNGGELDLRIGGTAVGTFDRLAVVGSATLGGRMVINSFNGFIPPRRSDYTIVSAAGGVIGTFQQVSGNLTNNPDLALTVEYLPNEVVLEFGGTNFSSMLDLTPNERAVARALDNVTINNNSNKLLDYLDALPVRSLPAAFDRIAPEEYGVIYQISVSSAKMQAVSVENRLDAIHASRAAYAGGPAGPPNPNSPEAAAQVAPLVGVFANATGEFVSVGDSYNAAGYNFDSGGVTFGADYRYSENFVAGALFNYTRTRADLVDGGRLDADGFRGGVYASLFGGGAYVNGFVGAGYNDYGMQRAGLDATVRGNSSGGEFNGLIQTGYDARIGAFTVGPIGAAQYTYTGLSSLQEQGSLDPLNISSSREQSIRTNIGARATYEWHVGSYILAPEIRATWQHEFGDVVDSVTSNMIFGSPNFTVTSSPIGRDSLLLNVGFTLTLSPQIAAYLFYDGELGRTNYQDSNLLMGLRANF